MNLRNATFSAARWTTVSALIRALAQLLQTAILARLLTPAEFGLMAMAGVALSISTLFADFGLSSALMHFQRPNRSTLSSLYWLNFLVAIGLALAFVIAGHVLASIYKQPSLISICTWLSLGFPLNALGQQFRILAEKELNFKPLAQNEIASVLAGFSAAIVMAKFGFGVFALVGAQLTTAATSSILAWIRLSHGCRPTSSFTLVLTRPFLTFGLHRIGGSFWNAMLGQTDIFFAGLVAPPHALATYATPRDQCLKIANLIINPVITRVGLPVMTQLKGDHAALQDIYSKTLRLGSSFNFPVYAFLAVFAEQITLLLLGTQWEDAAPFLRIFAIWGLIRSTGNPSGGLLYAVGLAKRAHLWAIFIFLSSAPIFWIFSQWGDLRLLALTMAVWQTVVFFVAWRFLIWPSCGLSLKGYTANFVPPLASTILAAAAACLASQAFHGSSQFIAGMVFFACTYLIASWWLNRPWLLALRELAAPAVDALHRNKH